MPYLSKVEGCGPKLFIENEDIVFALHCLTLHSFAFCVCTALHSRASSAETSYSDVVQDMAQHCTVQPSGVHCARVLFPPSPPDFALLLFHRSVSTLTFLSLPRLQLPALMHRLHQASHLQISKHGW